MFVFAFVIPLINHIVRDFQVALAVPGFGSHDRLHSIGFQPLAGFFIVFSGAVIGGGNRLDRGVGIQGIAFRFKTAGAEFVDKP